MTAYAYDEVFVLLEWIAFPENEKKIKIEQSRKLCLDAVMVISYERGLLLLIIIIVYQTKLNF